MPSHLVLRRVLVLFFVLCSFEGSAKEIGIEGFLSEAMREELSFQKSKVQLKAVETLAIISNDLSATEFQIGPYYNHSELRYSSASGDSTQGSWSGGVSGALSQHLPTGLELTLETSRVFTLHPLTSSQLDWDYSLSLSQDLGKNLFGGLDRLKTEEKELEWRAQEYSYRANYLKSCNDLIQKYVASYQSTQKLKVLAEILDSAKKVHDVSKKLYSKRLIKKIELLAAHSDYISSQSAFVVEQVKTERLMNELFSYKASIDHLKLLSPEVFLNELDKVVQLAAINIGAHPEVRAVQKESEAKKRSTEIAQRNEGVDLKLTLSAGHQTGTALVSGVESGLEGDYSNIQLNLTLPIGSTSLSAKKEQAMRDHGYAKLKIRKTEEALRLSMKNLFDERRSLIERSKLNTEKVKLNKDQVKEALRLYRAGKLEYSDYGSYRDRLSRESIQVEELRLNRWSNTVQLFYLVDSSQNFCGVI